MKQARLGPADLAEGQIRGFDLGERMVLVSRFDGGYFAISDWCNHAGCLLSKGTVDGRYVTCPCHGATFDLLTGTNVNAPHLCGDQDLWEIAVEGGELVVSFED
ncbi:MAG TPA: Rieske (2Fe-2S) protein [Myxococcales bacterium]|jgi:3-phenylpropionate/trans-cinnamate dioxygenase ferredoxin subunit